jgi:hypothetical protein
MASDTGCKEQWTSVDSYSISPFSGNRDTDAAKTFLTRLRGEYDVPEAIYVDQLRRYGAAIRQIPSLIGVDHQQVISTASGPPTTEIQVEETSAGIPAPTRQDQEPPPHPNPHLRCNQTNQPVASVPDVVFNRGRGGLKFSPPLPSARHDTSLRQRNPPDTFGAAHSSGRLDLHLKRPMPPDTFGVKGRRRARYFRC